MPLACSASSSVWPGSLPRLISAPMVARRARCTARSAVGQRLCHRFKRPDPGQIGQTGQQGDAALGLSQGGRQRIGGGLAKFGTNLGQGRVAVRQRGFEPRALFLDQGFEVRAAPSRPFDQARHILSGPRCCGQRILSLDRIEHMRKSGDAAGKTHGGMMATGVRKVQWAYDFAPRPDNRVRRSSVLLGVGPEVGVCLFQEAAPLFGLRLFFVIRGFP